MSGIKRSIREASQDRVLNVFVVTVLCFFGLAALYPLIFVVSASFSDPTAVTTGKVVLTPVGFHLDGYRKIFENPWVLTGYRNSLFYTSAGTLLNVFVTFMAAYALSRKDLWGRRWISIFMAIPMWFSGGLIPTFLVVDSLKLTNTIYVLLIVGLFSMYNCIICRTFIQTNIPGELQEAAIIDGCTDFGILWRIILPLSGPVIAIIALFYALEHWNQYFSALIYLNDRRLQPLQIFLREILIQSKEISLDVDLDDLAYQIRLSQVMRYSLIVVASVPMLLIYPYVQRFFVKGVMLGSVKG